MDDCGPPERGGCTPRGLASGVLTSYPPYWHAPPPPPVGRYHAVTAAIPTLSWLPDNYGILHDASWCPRTRRCGGAVAVFFPVTLRYQVYPVTIPIWLDNAYTAELYTAWVALTARGPSADPTFGFRCSSWHFADCKGYIMAQEGRREPDDSLQGDLIRERRAMASGHAPPRHLYSHITGTWLDPLLRGGGNANAFFLHFFAYPGANGFFLHILHFFCIFLHMFCLQFPFNVRIHGQICVTWCCKCCCC